MTQANRYPGHPSDGDLVRFLDRQISDVEGQRMRRHIAACPACEQRLSLLRSQAGRASEYLASMVADVGADELAKRRALAAVRAAAGHPRRAARRWRAGAAAAAVVAVATLAVPPVRAWVAEHLAREEAAQPVVTAPSVLPAMVAARPGPPVAFDVTGTEFRVELEHVQVGGELVLRGLGAERASAQILGGGEEAILVLPDGLRIQNEPESRATYRVTVPTGQRSVVVVVGDDTVAMLNAAERSARWVQRLPLAAPPSR